MWLELFVAIAGLILLVLLIFAWWQLTGWITAGIETMLCWGGGADCHLRGSYEFAIWSTVAVVTLVLIGLLIERLQSRLRNIDSASMRLDRHRRA